DEAEPRHNQIHGELDEEEEELDDWYDEEEVDDPEELKDAGVRVNLAIQLDEFLRNKRDRVGGSWEAVVPEPAAQPGDPDQIFFHLVPEIVLAKAPTVKGVELVRLENDYNAINLISSLRAFLRKEKLSISSIQLPANLMFSVWHRARLFYPPRPFKPSEGPHIDVIRAQPEKIDRFQRVCRPARFDAVMILMHPEKHGVHRKLSDWTSAPHF
ncbi:hypothetical protein BDV93DRAFT_564540, partial [Ceratobasidium sp. AG-I]